MGTIGHGIEALLMEKLLHGECVSIGCNIEAQIARDLGFFPNLHVGRVVRLLKSYGLPTKVPTEITVDDIMFKIGLDKKNVGTSIRMTVVKRIGESFDLPQPIEADMMRAALVPTTVVAPRGPSTPLCGTVPVPGSKSISNRVLLLAALGQGVCRLRGLLQSDDTAVMMAALTDMGVAFAWEENAQCSRGISACRSGLRATWWTAFAVSV